MSELVRRSLDTWKQLNGTRGVDVPSYLPSDGAGDCEGSSAHPSAPANQLSLCPWQWVADEDTNRVPKIVAFARCECARVKVGGAYVHCGRLEHPMLVKRVNASGALEVGFERFVGACMPMLRAESVVGTNTEVVNAPPKEV